MPSPVKLQRVRRGSAIEAETWNRMCDIVEALANVRSGAGIDATFGVDGLLIALIGGLKDRFVPCKITAAPPAGVPIRPSLCLYGYVGIGAAGVASPAGPGVAPVYGRQVKNDEVDVYPAEVGNLCGIFRNPQADGTKVAELIVLTEIPCIGDC